MKQGVPPPLSAIETPRVEDSRCFFSPEPIPDDLGHNSSQSVASQNRNKNCASRGRSGGRRPDKPTPTLKDDLDISESDDEGEVPYKKMPHRVSDYRSPSVNRSFQYGSSDIHSSHNQSSSQHYPLPRHGGGVPRSPPGTPPDSPPTSASGSSPGSVQGSLLQSLPGSPIHSLSGSPPSPPVGPRSPPPPLHGSSIHSPADDLVRGSRSPSVASESSNNSSSASSEGETSDEESDEKDAEEDQKDSDDHNDDLKDRRAKDKDYESNVLDERVGDGDDAVVQSGDDSAAKNWSLKNFMEKKNSPALPALATPGRSGLGFRSDRIGSDNTVASCDGKSDKSSLHLGHGGRYDLADHYSVNEILNPTSDIKEILRSPTLDIMELDNMRPNRNNMTGPSDLMSPINSPETPTPIMRREEPLRVPSNNSESKRHSSSYYNLAATSSVSPCGKRNNDEEDLVQPTVRARTANKTNKHKSRRDMNKSRRSSSELSEGELDSDSDKKSVSPKRSSSSSNSSSSEDQNEKTVTTVTVPISRKNNSSADSRKPRQMLGKKEVKKIGQNKESAKVKNADEKAKNKRTPMINQRRSVSPEAKEMAKSSSKVKAVKKEKVKPKKAIVKEETRKTTKMPGRPPGSGKVASKTVATSKKASGDKNDKSRKGKTSNFPSKEYIDSSSSSDSSASDGDSNSDEEEEDGAVCGVVGRSPRIKPVATVAPLPPSRMDSPVNTLKPPPVEPVPVKAVVAPITQPEISLPNKDINVPIKRLAPGRPPGKTKSSKEKMERALVGRKKMPVEIKAELNRPQVLSSPISDHTEYKGNNLPESLMVRINLSLLDRVPPYPPASRGSAAKTGEKTHDGGSRSSKSRDSSQNGAAQKDSADIVKRDSSMESVSRVREAKDVVKKKSSSVETASRPSKCRTPPPLKRKIKEEKQEVPYAKRPKMKQEKPDERTNMSVDDDSRYENFTPKIERSDSVNSLASLASQQSHHGSLRSSTPTGLKRKIKREKKELKEFPSEAAPKSVSVPRAGAITPSESKKPSVPIKKELTSNVASVVSEKEARKREKEEKRKHRNRSKENPEATAPLSVGLSAKSNDGGSQAPHKDFERVDVDKAKIKRIKTSPKREPEEGFHATNSKVAKESSKGEKKSCDKGPNDNSNAAQYRLDYEPTDRPSDYYLGEAKRLKHQADKESNRTLQVMKYLEAILYFILTGNAMEEAHTDKDKVYTMFKETLHLIKSISSKFQKNQSSSSGSMDNKLAVLSLRCQSRLFFKLFAIRKSEMKDFQRKITEYQKSPPGKLATQLSLAAAASIPNQVLTTGHQLKSPCQPARGLSGIGVNGVPSPHSPTPSPAGSVASVGSQSSGYTSSSNELNGSQGRHAMPNNSHHGIIVPPGNITHQSSSGSTVTIPAIVYNMIQKQQSHFSNLQQCHDLWEQGDYLIECCHAKEFFGGLDEECGKLTIQSTISQLVHYVHQGLKYLKDSDT